jgi:hypothetical protein
MKSHDDPQYKLAQGKKPTKRDHEFQAIVERCEKVVNETGKDDPSGFSHAFLWAVVTIGKHSRKCLITGSLNFINWQEVRAAVGKVGGVQSTWINWD